MGPVALDPGAEASVGTELKWYGQQASLGYVIKLFLHVETGGLNVLRLSAESLDGGQPMLFDYPKGHLEDRGGYRPTVTYDSSDLEQFAKLTRAAAGSAGIPGAAVAPSLGPYRFTVEGSQGKTWTRTITVCHPVVPAISK